MDYYQARAYEVSRLSYEEYLSLRTKETNVGRCMMPYEIQRLLCLPPLKEHYQIPSDDQVQAAHNLRIKGDMRAASLIPKGEELSLTDLAEVHQWDERVRLASDDLKVDFKFRGSGRKRLSEDIE